jgi:predicted small integral membrane protein
MSVVSTSADKLFIALITSAACWLYFVSLSSAAWSDSINSAQLPF